MTTATEKTAAEVQMERDAFTFGFCKFAHDVGLTAEEYEQFAKTADTVIEQISKQPEAK